MCGISAIRTDLRVSIQARGAQNTVEGDLAIGILADSNLVVVPNPPRALLDDNLEFDVWIIPVPVAVDKTVEVIQPLKNNFLGLRSNPGEPTVVYIELAHHSMYASQVARCDGRELGRYLEEYDGDMWQALVSIGAVPEGLSQGIGEETLLAAEDALRQQRRPRRSDMRLDSYADLGVAFCWPWVCFCRTDEDANYGSLASGGSDETAQ